MANKFRVWFVITAIILISMATIGASGGWYGPLYQIGMDMSTATPQPSSTGSTTDPQLQGTPTPSVINPGSGLASPTMTSIFTGFTPNPNGMSTYVMPMGGSGMMGGGMMGGGMMGSSSGITGTMGTTGMGMSGMGMSGCSMMSGSSMGSNGMSDDVDGGGMDMSDDMWMTGIDMSTLSSSEEAEPSLASTNPWWILGWVVLGLVILAILAGAVLGIVWLVRRSSKTQQVQS